MPYEKYFVHIYLNHLKNLTKKVKKHKIQNLFLIYRILTKIKKKNWNLYLFFQDRNARNVKLSKKDETG